MTIEPEGVEGVHLVGSVPLADSAAVFSLVGEKLGRHVSRIPDGETGTRISWIGWQYPILSGMSQFEPDMTLGGPYRTRTRLRLRPGVTPADIVFPALGYAEAALASFDEFCRQKQSGAIPAGVRFQVCLPTPLAPIQSSFAPGSQAAIEPAYEARLLAELDQIVASIPQEDLAIQWDAAIEFAILEGVMPTHMADPWRGIIERLVRVGNRVPRAVELGYHLCYGDVGHRHFMEPADTELMVRVSNALAEDLSRSTDFIHLPVPRDRGDDAYFAPLAKLKLARETSLFLGLVHFTDGIDGTRARIEAAKRHVAGFGIGTECGMGRRPADTIPALLDLHARTAQPIR